MSATNQAMVRPVLERPTFHRDYATRRFLGRQEHFEYLLDHMDACSALSEHAGLINYRAVAQPDGRLYAENTEKAAGFLALVGCAPNERVYYMEGTQRGLFTAKGCGVIVVKYSQVTPDEMEFSGRLYVRIENSVVATLARVFFIFAKGAVDRNFNLVMRQPIDLTQLASGFPKELNEVIQQLPAADYPLVEPFGRLLTGAPQ
ncbi:MAG: hypothetical protein WCS70_03460 [Verrucomicrobiota bacterium]